jgi:tetratricopeptide (TPR) repeat protein
MIRQWMKGGVAAIAVTCLSGTGFPAEVTMRSARLSIPSPNELAVCDVDADGAFEVLVSGIRGNLALYDLRTLKPLWQILVSSKAITSPVAGDFLGTGERIIAVGSAGGSVIFLRAGTGDTLATFSVGTGVTVAPTVVPMEKRDGSPRDGLVVCDDTGNIHLLSVKGSTVSEEFAVANTVEDEFGRHSSAGRITKPASIGDITGDGVPEIVAGTALGKIFAVSVNNPAKRYIWHGPQGTVISTSVAIGDFFKTGTQDLAFGTETGDLMVITCDQKEGSRSFRAVVEQQKLVGPANSHLLVSDFDRDGALDIVGASADAVVGFQGALGMARFGTPYASNAPPFSPISLVSVEGNEPGVVVADSKGVIYIVDPMLRKPARRFGGEEPFNGFAPAGNLTGRGKVEVVFLSQNKSHLSLATLNVAADSNSMPTAAYGASFQRDGQLTDAARSRLAAADKKLRDAIDALLAKATDALSANDYAGTLRSVAEALALSPRDIRANALHVKAYRKLHWFRQLVGYLAALGILTATGWLAWRILARKRRFKHAEKLVEAGDFETAITTYRGLYATEPRNRRLALALAEAYIQAGNIDARAVDALEAAHQTFPENSDVTVALAKAYSAAGVETNEALEIYHIAMAVLETDRGLIAFHAAKALEERGETDSALRYYKVAVKEGGDRDRIYTRLADLYLDTNQFTDKTLPVFEYAAPKRQDDPRFLEGLCRSYAAARKVDDRSRAAASRLLELKPDSIVALRQLAKCELQAGHAEEAAEFAGRAFQADPDDETALLLSHCFKALQRTDAKARDIYRRALNMTPGQPDLLRAAALSIADAVTDDDYAMLRQACSANPLDEELLNKLAEIAANRDDLETAIDCYEKLVGLGLESIGMFRSLAGLYSRIGDTSPKTLTAYRETLKADPGNQKYLTHLARVYVAENRTDAESVNLLEKAFQKDPSDACIGLHLARAYVAGERYDDALKLTRWLLQTDKENQELQKLCASASLSNNRIDEAIRQYEHLLRSHPGDAEANVNLAVAFAQKQRTDDAAAQQYSAALVFAPDDARVRMALARHHALAGRYARALEEFRLAIAGNATVERRVCEELRTLITGAPDRSDLRWFLANALIDSNSLREASEQLQAILEIDPGQLKPILQAYDRILSKDPSNLGANLQKGILLKAQGRFEEARPLLERALQMNRQNAEAASELEELYEKMAEEGDDVAVRFELGKLCHGRGNFDKAIAQFQKTAQDFRYENESIKMLGLSLVGKGMLEYALQEFRKLVVDEDMKEILYDLAHRYEAKSDLVGAKQVYKMLFTADINYRNVKSKFEMLAGSTSDPLQLERSTLMTQLSERARRRYELIEEIGRGAMGIVYRARDNELDEIVALKILPDNLSQNPDALNRFRAEARSARRLSHPNIVRIHDIGEEMGRKYISMEFIKGIDLKKHFRQKGKLPPPELAMIMMPTCAAIDYAHSMNIVHRDIKPANIILTEQLVPKVSDFGIAKALESTSETLAGAIIGTPLYMSPEQVQGQPVDTRADIYSLGIMMYELASGKPPFTEGDLAYQHCRVPPKPLADVPPALNDIIMKCLEKDRENRWRTAGEIRTALEKSGVLPPQGETRLQ